MLSSRPAKRMRDAAYLRSMPACGGGCIAPGRSADDRTPPPSTRVWGVAACFWPARLLSPIGSCLAHSFLRCRCGRGCGPPVARPCRLGSSGSRQARASGRRPRFHGRRSSCSAGIEGWSIVVSYSSNIRRSGSRLWSSLRAYALGVGRERWPRAFSGESHLRSGSHRTWCSRSVGSTSARSCEYRSRRGIHIRDSRFFVLAVGQRLPASRNESLVVFPQNRNCPSRQYNI